MFTVYTDDKKKKTRNVAQEAFDSMEDVYETEARILAEKEAEEQATQAAKAFLDEQIALVEEREATEADALTWFKSADDRE